ncbi:MAG: hydroxymethylbilane synthase [Candidatus Acidiferrales bacterium]
MKSLRIGSRGSALALWQANHIRELLHNLHGVESEIVPIKTSGDEFQSAAVSLIGSKGVFIKEIEDALLAHRVDLAVHSMKDVPTEIPAGLAFPAITKREDVHDCAVSRDGIKINEFPAGARVGTGSLRRQSQLLHRFPSLVCVALRGNVDTRLRKLDAGQFDSVILAKAGLDRLGASHRITEILSAEWMLPAAGQGALGIEARECDEATLQLLAPLNHAETRACVTAERVLLAGLEGGCQVPIGAWGRIERGELVLDACVLSHDGAEYLRDRAVGSANDPETLGRGLAHKLIEAGAGHILRLAGRQVGNV